MKEVDQRQLLREWDAACEDLDAEAAYEAVRCLPDRAAYALAKDGSVLVGFEPGPDVIWTLLRDAEGNFTTIRRPLMGDKLVICRERGELPLPGTGNMLVRSSRWTFRHLGADDSAEPWQTISGSATIHPHSGAETRIDRWERLARSIAAAIGWQVDGLEPEQHITDPEA